MMLGALSAAQAQNDTVAGGPTQADTTGCPRSEFDWLLGIQGGVSLFAMDNSSPYCSKYGLLLEIQMLMTYKAPLHWNLSFGPTYRFQWSPLYYAVAPVDGGIAADPTPQVGKQHGYIYRNHLGILLKFNWFPIAKEHEALSLAFDCYAAYGVSGAIKLDRVWPGGHSGGVYGTGGDDRSLCPWKLELGLTLGTNVIGMIHGVRLFGNLLPEYKDPTTGDKIRTIGMTFYL